jgi:CubicO group peptidase (beta-lactamase class C family)
MRYAPILAAMTCFVFLGAAKPAQTNREILGAWLASFNAGDAASLTDFEKHYLGDSDIAFAQDSREETGGFELVKVETDNALHLTALVKEHDSKEQWEVTLERKAADQSALSKLGYKPLPMSQADAIAALDALAARLQAADKFSGMLLVRKGGSDLYRKAWGLADREAKVPVTQDTRFYFASQGKMFTAVAALQLIEAHKMSFDDTVGKFLPDYPNADIARKVTVRELLTHRGGTGDMDLLGPSDTKNRDRVRSIADIIAINGARAPDFEPGTKMDYSNYGYVLLGAMIEKASGEDYYEYLDRHVFRPAGMLSTGYPLREDTRGIATAYTMRSDKGYVVFDAPPDGAKLVNGMDLLPWRGTPAGGGVSTADDEARFAVALNEGRLISPAMLAQATSNQSEGWYGYGFIVTGTKDYPFWGHGGGAYGNSLVFDYYPTTGVTLVCMSNLDPPVCDRLALSYYRRSPRAP